MVGFEAVWTGIDQIPVSNARQAFDSDAVPNRELKSACVRFEIIRHLVFGRKRERPARKLHAGEAIEGGRRKEAKRVPPLSPCVAHALIGVENDERPTPACQVVADGESRLAAADDNCLKGLTSLLLHDVHLTAMVRTELGRPHRLKCVARQKNSYGYFYVEEVSIRRCSNAYAVAAARLETSSLLKMLLICRATVFSLRSSSPAMTLFVRPVATSRRTWSSRVVSPAADRSAASGVCRRARSNLAPSCWNARQAASSSTSALSLSLRTRH